MCQRYQERSGSPEMISWRVPGYPAHPAGVSSQFCALPCSRGTCCKGSSGVFWCSCRRKVKKENIQNNYAVLEENAQETKAPSCVTVTWGDSKHPLFGQSGSPVLAVPSQFSMHSHPMPAQLDGKQERPWFCVSPNQQQQKHLCITNLCSGQSQNSALPATGKKISSTPAHTVK